jgi:hypothetical protein
VKRRSKKRDEAAGFILRALSDADGPLEAEEIKRLAADEKIKPSTLEDAAKALGIDRSKRAGRNVFIWSLPDTNRSIAPTLCECNHSNSRSPYKSMV